MKNKKLTKITINVPEYIMEKIIKIDEEYPSTTRTGTILAILEKGLNWFAKQRKALEQSDKTPGQSEGGKPSTVDQQNNTPTPRGNNVTNYKKWKLDPNSVNKELADWFKEHTEEMNKYEEILDRIYHS